MALLRDFIQLVGKAIASGVAVGVTAALVVMGLANTAQAADANDQVLVVAKADVTAKPRSTVPTLPPIEGGPSGVGALWATHETSALDLLLGLFALATAGMVAVIGRTVPAGGSRS